jgi:hypothetical protein
MQGARLPRQASAFSEGSENLLRSLHKDFLKAETRQGGAAEAEQAQSAGRRLRPEAVSGRCAEHEIGDEESIGNAAPTAEKSSGNHSQR